MFRSVILRSAPRRNVLLSFVSSFSALVVLVLGASFVPLAAQKVDWGYRVKAGQTLHYLKHQTMIVEAKPEALSLEEHFEVVIRAVDSSGSFLCSVRSAYEQARPDSSGSATYSTVFHGPSIIADGTFAELSIARNGRFLAGRFEKEPYYSIKRREANIHLRAHGKASKAVETEQELLRHIANDLFPPVCDSSACTVGSSWIDSVNVRSMRDPKDSTKIEYERNPDISPLQWRLASVGYYGETKCDVVSVRQQNVLLMKRQPDDAILATRQDIYLRHSDGVVVHQDAELKGSMSDGRIWTCQVQYDLEP